jgi:hypothetical protein
MAISLQADATLPLAYLNINGTTGAVVSASGIAPTWLTRSSAYTASNGDHIAANTSSSAFTITLPASPATGAQVVIFDAGGSWATRNLTVARNGQTIEGLAEDLVCNVNNRRVALYFTGTTWRIIA